MERELVLRLASLLWRLRRATTMETGLFEIQAEQLREFSQSRDAQPHTRALIYAISDRTNGTEPLPSSGPKSFDPASEFARCFLRLANLPSYPLDRLSRYEAVLWRQAGQILFALDALNRRKPQERGRRFRIVVGNLVPTTAQDIRSTAINSEMKRSHDLSCCGLNWTVIFSSENGLAIKQ